MDVFDRDDSFLQQGFRPGGREDGTDPFHTPQPFGRNGMKKTPDKSACGIMISLYNALMI